VNGDLDSAGLCSCQRFIQAIECRGHAAEIVARANHPIWIGKIFCRGKILEQVIFEIEPAIGRNVLQRRPEAAARIVIQQGVATFFPSAECQDQRLFRLVEITYELNCAVQLLETIQSQFDQVGDFCPLLDCEPHLFQVGGADRDADSAHAGLEIG
jgi:hypothetical protein